MAPADRDPFDRDTALIPLGARPRLGVAGPPPAPDRSEPLGTLHRNPLGAPPAEANAGAPLAPGGFPYRLAPETPQVDFAFTRPVRHAPPPQPPPAVAQRDTGAAARVHQGPAAAATARALGAAAFTVGTAVFVGDAAQEASPERQQGLLAHELTHARQALEGGAPADATGREREAGGAEALVLARAAGQRIPHLLVDHFVRSYAAAGGGPISALERARLDRISLRALEKSDALLARDRDAAAYRELAEVRVSLQLDLSGLTDDQASDRWAAAIATAVREQAGPR